MTLEAERLTGIAPIFTDQLERAKAHERADVDPSGAFREMMVMMRQKAYGRTMCDPHYARDAAVYDDVVSTRMIWGDRTSLLITDFGQENMHCNFGLGPNGEFTVLVVRRSGDHSYDVTPITDTCERSQLVGDLTDVLYDHLATADDESDVAAREGAKRVLELR